MKSEAKGRRVYVAPGVVVLGSVRALTAQVPSTLKTASANEGAIGANAFRA